MWLSTLDRALEARSFRPNTPKHLVAPAALIDVLQRYPEASTADARSLLAVQRLSQIALRMVQELSRLEDPDSPIGSLRDIDTNWSRLGAVSNSEVCEDLKATASQYGDGKATPRRLNAVLISAAALITAVWELDDRGILIKPEVADLATMVAEFTVVYTVHRDYCGLNASWRLVEELATELAAN